MSVFLKSIHRDSQHLQPSKQAACVFNILQSTHGKKLKLSIAHYHIWNSSGFADLVFHFPKLVINRFVSSPYRWPWWSGYILLRYEMAWEQVSDGSIEVKYDNKFAILNLVSDLNFTIYHNYSNHWYCMVLRDIHWNLNEKYKSFLISIIQSRISPFWSFNTIRLPCSHSDGRTVHF